MVRTGTVLAGRYWLEDRIASGGMGEVWRAFDRVLGRSVAVKILLGGLPDDPTFVDRFRTEARTMATISHPGVVEVYDFGDDPQAGVYLVMKFIEGESLAHTLSRVGRLGPEATMRLVAEAAEALHAAHRRGVTHRDIKPGNLLLRPDGTTLLTDFGIARSDGSTGHTTTGSLMGTAGYIAPERAEGHPATVRSDVYSLGVVAYRCLAGRPPFAGDSALEVALRHVRDQPPPLPPDVPSRVRAVVERAMAKDPADRWPSAAVLAAEARNAMGLPPDAGEPTEASATAVVAQPELRKRGGRRVLAGVATLFVVAGVAAAAIALDNRGGAQPQSLPSNPVSSALDPAAEVNTSPSPAAASAASSSAAQPSTRPRTTNPTAAPRASLPTTATGTKPPAVPKNLTATPLTANTIRLKWTDASSDEDGFTITNGAVSRNVAAGKTAYDWTGLAAATYSCFKIRAYSASGTSAYYPSASGDWVCATSLSGVGPTPPANVTATAVDSSSIRLQWTDESANEDGFSITNGATSRTTAANATSYTWDGLAPGTYMCFKVRAYTVAGVSAYSPAGQDTWACVTTPSA